MPARKPQSVIEEPITSFDQITPEFLAEKERQWDDVRLKELALNNLKKLGQDTQKAKREYNSLENESKLRAIRALNLGYDKRELAEALGVPTQTITKWAKESNK